ncbi:MAG: Asp23/Gls24 family envelope stress response protein [Clostridia bacterium]|nr:Asp23/Gls24 family envelope stress response protein [Clostridia bacterium]
MASNAYFELAKGGVTVESEVIAKIAGYVAGMSYGVVGMAYRSKSDSVASLLKKDNYTKGIKVSISEDKISVDIHIIIEYGVNINVIGKSIIKNVKYQLSHMTGLDVEQVNVCVEGFRVQEQE